MNCRGCTPKRSHYLLAMGFIASRLNSLSEAGSLLITIRATWIGAGGIGQHWRCSRLQPGKCKKRNQAPENALCRALSVRRGKGFRQQ